MSCRGNGIYNLTSNSRTSTESNAILQAEVIAIGDELTSGQRLDTNSQWISQQLCELGIQTIRHTTVGDDLAFNIAALRNAVRRADVVICSGGLGPTLDDLTRQAIAEAFDRPLRLDEASLVHIQAMFANRQREMPERNRVQAMLPTDSQVIPNPHGSAPGIDLIVPAPSEMRRSPETHRPSENHSAPETSQTEKTLSAADIHTTPPEASLGTAAATATSRKTTARIFALPGVPAELREMWQQTVVGRLESMLDSGVGPLRYFSVKVFGIGESDVEVKLPDLIDRKRTPTVGITVSRATITLRIAGRARSEAEFHSLVSPTLTEIHHALGELVFGQGNEELEDIVMRELHRRGQTLACVEIGAASWLSDWLLQAAVPAHPLALQSSDTSTYRTGEHPAAGITNFAGGIAFPTLPQAERWLSAQPESPDDAWRQLAIQARARFNADLGLAVGIYPSLQTMEASNTTFEFHFALASVDQVHFERRSLGGHPDVLGPRVAKTALDMVRKWLR